jgi:hypothetical protein
LVRAMCGMLACVPCCHVSWLFVPSWLGGIVSWLIKLILGLFWYLRVVKTIEIRACAHCGAPISVLFAGVCIRCAESLEPPLLSWCSVKASAGLG